MATERRRYEMPQFYANTKGGNNLENKKSKFETILCIICTMGFLIIALNYLYKFYLHIVIKNTPEITKTHQFSTTELTDYQKSRIAHGGGALEGNTYLNCYDPVKYYYDKGIRLFELDIEYTTDNVPVMLHSWDGFQFKYMGLDRDKIYSYEEFMDAKMINNYTQLNLDSTINYMKTEFPELFLVTDTKENNKELLLTLSTKYSEILDRIIPQVYNQDEYIYAKDLGFKNIIYTLYVSEDTDDEVVDFCRKNKVFAITMPKSRAIDTDLAEKLSYINVYVYSHTVNGEDEFKNLKEKGVCGIYTDTLF